MNGSVAVLRRRNNISTALKTLWVSTSLVGQSYYCYCNGFVVSSGIPTTLVISSTIIRSQQRRYITTHPTTTTNINHNHHHHHHHYQRHRHIMTISSSNENNNDDDETTRGLSDLTSTTTTTTTTLSSSSSSSSSLTPWYETISTSISRSRKIRGGNYVQIATTDPISHEPRCRTVVFRGFLNLPSSLPKDDVAPLSHACDEGHVLKMITDLRSDKVSETTTTTTANDDDDTTTNNNNNNNNNTAEMVWWFSKSSEQYRLRGSLHFVGGGTFPWDDTNEDLQRERRQQWGNLSDMAREQFYWSDPGVDYEEVQKTTTAVPVGGRDEEGKVLQPPPDNFLLMLLYPRRVDYLRLGDNYRQIDEYYDGKEEREEVGGGGWKLKRVNP